MSKDHTKTVQIRKIDKVAPDHRGRSVWLGKVEAIELELVSTTALEKILKTEGGKTRSEIQKLAAGRKDGVLARDTATGHFRILSDADLKKAVPAGDGSEALRRSDRRAAHRDHAQEGRRAVARQHADPAEGHEAGRQGRGREAEGRPRRTSSGASTPTTTTDRADLQLPWLRRHSWTQACNSFGGSGFA